MWEKNFSLFLNNGFGDQTKLFLRIKIKELKEGLIIDLFEANQNSWQDTCLAHWKQCKQHKAVCWKRKKSTLVSDFNFSFLSYCCWSTSNFVIKPLLVVKCRIGCGRFRLTKQIHLLDCFRCMSSDLLLLLLPSLIYTLNSFYLMWINIYMFS